MRNCKSNYLSATLTNITTPTQILPVTVPVPVASQSLFLYLHPPFTLTPLSLCSHTRYQGLRPEIIPSTFAENLPHSTYAHSLAEYPIATAYEKAMEVYERLLSSEGVDGENPPDLVISADTVIVFPPQLTPGTSENPESTAREVLGSGSSRGGRSNGTSSFGAAPSKVLEKPMDKHDQMKMLSDLNGKTCEVVTGVTIVYPTIAQPGFRMQSVISHPSSELSNAGLCRRSELLTMKPVGQHILPYPLFCYRHLSSCPSFHPFLSFRSISISTLVHFNDNSVSTHLSSEWRLAGGNGSGSMPMRIEKHGRMARSKAIAFWNHRD